MRSVPELIAVLGSQPAGEAGHKPGGRLPFLSARPGLQLPSQPLRGLLPISLLGEQRQEDMQFICGATVNVKGLFTEHELLFSSYAVNKS